ncbi:MAG: NAD+ kinase [Spirochaetia bacterium]|nr:NAD+ kinase [Spirochaetia bacterium]
MKPVLIALKRSKWERDIMFYGSEDAAKKIYTLQNHTFERIYNSHLRQIEARKKISGIFPHAVRAFREELPSVDFSKYSLILSLGGDNHFVHTAQYVNEIPIGGINSDPETSSGVLLYFNLQSFSEPGRKEYDSDQIETENWSLIECEIHFSDGQKIFTGEAVSEISIRNKFAEHMSRYLIRSAGTDPEEQKCSGLLLSTGTGSTGWFSNCVPVEAFQGNCSFEKNAGFFRFTARERKTGEKFSLHYGEIQKGGTLELISEMDGIICMDSDNKRVYPFPPGSKAYFRLSEKKLRVVRKFN